MSQQNHHAGPEAAGTPPHASPAMRRFARELGVDLALIAGTGPMRRILKTDLQDFVRQAVQKPAGANLARDAAPMTNVTCFGEADITDLEAFRLAANEKRPGSVELTVLAFLIKICAVTLQKHPALNAAPGNGDPILNIGIAKDTPLGLVVPVIENAGGKGLIALAAEAATLAEQARAGTLKATDMQGGCFTIFASGTPIATTPAAASLGAGRAKITPVWDGSGFRPRLILPLSLSCDQHAGAPAEAASCLATITALLADFRQILLW